MDIGSRVRITQPDLAAFEDPLGVKLAQGVRLGVGDEGTVWGEAPNDWLRDRGWFIVDAVKDGTRCFVPVTADHVEPIRKDAHGSYG